MSSLLFFIPLYNRIMSTLFTFIIVVGLSGQQKMLLIRVIWGCNEERPEFNVLFTLTQNSSAFWGTVQKLFVQNRLEKYLKI